MMNQVEEKLQEFLEALVNETGRHDIEVELRLPRGIFELLRVHVQAKFPYEYQRDFKAQAFQMHGSGKTFLKILPMDNGSL